MHHLARHQLTVAALLLACWPLAGAAAAPVKIELYPPKARITSARQHIQLVVSGRSSDGQHRDLTRVAKFSSSDPKVAVVRSGVVIGKSNGTATIRAKVGDQVAEARIEVVSIERPDPVSFRSETIAALTKSGCNAGACHGSPSGKGGFSLSMLGYDPTIDQRSLIRGGWNRRTNMIEPERSLMLRKPTMQIAHGGGRRLRSTDAAYDVLRRWIEEGTSSDIATAARLERIEIYPRSGSVLRWPDPTQQLSVRAHFAGGAVRDVTAIATYTSSDEEIATVDAAGLIHGADRGATAINIRYLDEVRSLTFMFVRPVKGFVWNDPPNNNYVDEKVHEQLKLLNYLPSETCDDGQFIRRVYLDAIGLLPPVDEVERFVADKDPAKRAKLIDKLLARPEHALFWAQRWADLLRVNEKRLTAEGARGYHEWIVKAVGDNTPWDQFASALLTASGDTYKNPPANYYRAAGDTAAVTETTAQLFMGVRIGCAKCHNHPFESWTQDDYYGISAVFNGVKRQGGKAAMMISASGPGGITQPNTGRAMKPALPKIGEVEVAKGVDPRKLFADWLVKRDNPYFARVTVNRIWAHLLGRGMVEPVDDFRSSNPPSNPALLGALAKDFVEHRFDVRHVLRTILNSRTYQRSAVRNKMNETDRRHFSAFSPRLLTAEQLLDAIGDVTGLPETFDGVAKGTRATQLPTPRTNEFLSAFGQPARETACSCERSTEPTLTQALQLLNGPTMQGKIAAGRGRLKELIAEKKSDAEIIDTFYLAALARRPEKKQREVAVAYVKSQSDRGKALEDVLWAILNSRQFLFQH